MINPTIVEGQVSGGVAQGLSTVLYERFVYDEDGQPARDHPARLPAADRRRGARHRDRAPGVAAAGPDQLPRRRRERRGGLTGRVVERDRRRARALRRARHREVPRPRPHRRPRSSRLNISSTCRRQRPFELSLMGDDAPLWSPSPERAEATRLAAFRRRAGAPTMRPCTRGRSSDPEEFWPLVWDDCGVVGDPGPIGDPPRRALRRHPLLPRRTAVGRREPPRPTRRRRSRQRTRSWRSTSPERGARERGTSCAPTRPRPPARSASLGVQPGDRVVTWLPNALEAVIVMLGATSIGAVYSSTSPDFGTARVLDRFGQIEPVVLFAADSYLYGGKRFDCLERLDEIRAGLPTLRATVVVGDAPADTVGWDDVPRRRIATSPFAPERFAFDHPWYVLYSSGTTGVPKCIVHRAGGVLLQHFKEQQLHCDIRRGDRVMYFTTTGWMMWNWLVSTLGIGRHRGALRRLAVPSRAERVVRRRRHGTAHAARRVGEVHRLGRQGADPAAPPPTGSTPCARSAPPARRSHPMGSAWSTSGSSPTCTSRRLPAAPTCAAAWSGGDPTGPVYAGEIQRPVLGMAVDAAADDGSSLRDSPGVPGELVCRQPFPSMPLGFWGDTDGDERYRAAYFERFPEVWAHGDFASWTVHGGMVIHGRSDATLNPGGVRIGTAEIYRVVESMPDVLEALAFGQRVAGRLPDRAARSSRRRR